MSEFQCGSIEITEIIAALLIGGWAVRTEHLKIGGIVAFISGIGRLNDLWGDLVNYFREISLTPARYEMVADDVNAERSCVRRSR